MSRMPRVSYVLHRAGNAADKVENFFGHFVRASVAAEPNPIRLEEGLRLIRDTAPDTFRRVGFLQHEIIPALGLNNEYLHEQPAELRDAIGKGFGWRIWQYPSQFARYLAFLIERAPTIDTYVEIGTRFGGTFVLTCEVLAKFNPHFDKALAVDLIDLPPLLEQYRKHRAFEYFKGDSASRSFAELIADRRIDLALIDGDHFIDGVLKDFSLLRERTRMLVFHDITSTACPATTAFWKTAKQLLGETYSFSEFTDQYSDVAGGPYLGIGVASRR